jgi:hypothetical protein
MTTPPSHWLNGLLRMAFMVFVIAVLLHLAAQLIEAVWPVLVGVGMVALIGFAGWSVYQFRRSRW